jgi:hypothetical protein
MSISFLKKCRLLLVHDLFDKNISLDKLKTLGNFDTVVVSKLCGNSYFFNISKFKNFKVICLDKSLNIHFQDIVGLINHPNLHTFDRDFAKKYDKKILSIDDKIYYKQILTRIGTGKIMYSPVRSDTKYKMTFHDDLTYEIIE